MRAGDSLRVSTLRLLIAAIHNREIAKQKPLSEEEVQAEIRGEAKKRRESIEQFRKGGRSDLVRKEEAELKLLENYLPAALSEEELARLAEEASREAGASGPKDLGRVMGKLMAKLKGRADGQAARQAAEKYLAGLSA